MFNWKKVSLILLASAALLSGCTQSNIVSPADGKIQGDGQPDTEIDKIQLVYYLDSRSGDFYPVWCLIQDIDGLEQIEVCVHAVTGDVVY